MIVFVSRFLFVVCVRYLLENIDISSVLSCVRQASNEIKVDLKQYLCHNSF